MAPEAKEVRGSAEGVGKIPGEEGNNVDNHANPPSPLTDL